MTDRKASFEDFILIFQTRHSQTHAKEIRTQRLKERTLTIKIKGENNGWMMESFHSTLWSFLRNINVVKIERSSGRSFNHVRQRILHVTEQRLPYFTEVN